MIAFALLDFAKENWRSAIEVILLWIVIYHGYLYFRGTRGAAVLTGLVVIFITLTLISQLLQLMVISWIIRSLTTFLAIALLIIFQPELRRALAALGSHHIFSVVTQNREAIELLTDATFELASRQFGALIALERDTNIRSFAESGVNINCELSTEMIVTVFQPKTPLHDGGMVINNDQILAAGCIFPVSQREDLGRDLGLRHRAGLGITEETDAIAIVVSEETGIVSICHRGSVERKFDPETFKRRLSELLLLDKNEKTDSTRTSQSGSKDRLAASGDSSVVSH